MKTENLRWWAAGVFASLAILQAVKWGAMGLAVQGPLLLLLVIGLVVAGFRDTLPFRNHFLFVFAYGSVFLLMWAVGNPGVELVVGRTWVATVGGLVTLAGVLIWNLKGRQDFKWLLAFIGATGFGLLIAFICGPNGGPDWMHNFFMRVWNLEPEEWEIAHKAVAMIRKSLHFLGYGLAALCTAVMAYRVRKDVWRSALFGIAWPLPIAIFDESQQQLSAVRTGQVWDVLLDFGGMVTFLTVFVIWNLRKEKYDFEE